MRTQATRIQWSLTALPNHSFGCCSVVRHVYIWTWEKQAKTLCIEGE